MGLAVARALALGGREVMVLEQERSIGAHTSSRNSEVIHAGLYYRKGTLRAQLFPRARDLMSRRPKRSASRYLKHSLQQPIRWSSETAGIHHACWRCGRLAACGSRAATVDAGHWSARQRIA